jgi:hypothetical protein
MTMRAQLHVCARKNYGVDELDMGASEKDLSISEGDKKCLLLTCIGDVF